MYIVLLFSGHATAVAVGKAEVDVVELVLLEVLVVNMLVAEPVVLGRALVDVWLLILLVLRVVVVVLPAGQSWSGGSSRAPQMPAFCTGGPSADFI